MIDERINKIRYELGDAMGEHAPDYFRRRSHINGWMIGAGGLLAAMGIGYLALRLADKRLQEVIDRFMPRMTGNGRMRQPVKSKGSGRTPQGRTERPTVHGTEGGEMPNTQDS